jgi:hypothetical protein
MPFRRRTTVGATRVANVNNRIVSILVKKGGLLLRLLMMVVIVHGKKES